MYYRRHYLHSNIEQQQNIFSMFRKELNIQTTILILHFILKSSVFIETDMYVSKIFIKVISVNALISKQVH